MLLEVKGIYKHGKIEVEEKPAGMENAQTKGRDNS